ncbi:protein LIFEGUARD 4-like [Impatiens glandulifera]|uniref:protein LIFEGUARD 4-like n=1 Tax=Impatiens glandulifera TaxID=253017 RepID=UPI001FB15D2B|nr:protein LIFEGUARD 4-like [Impatiens glandulifera]
MLQSYNKNDLESGTSHPLYPNMIESPEFRWAFIRKIYSILVFQLLLTVAVASIWCGRCIIITNVIPSTFSYWLYSIPVWLFLLDSLVLLPKLIYSFFVGKVVLEAAILTSVVVIALTLYTFWAAKRGHDFSFLGPFLFSALLVILVFAFIQIFFPMGKLSLMIYGGLSALVFSGYIIYDTDNIIKRYSYDEYIWASVNLYLDIVNLFLAFLTIFKAADS